MSALIHLLRGPFLTCKQPISPCANTITRHGKQPASEKNTDLDIRMVHPGADSWGCVEEGTEEKPRGGERRAKRMPEVQNGSTSHQNAPWQQLVSGITVLKVLHAWQTRPFVGITRRGASKTGRRGRKSRLTWLASGSTSAFSKMYFPVTGELCASSQQRRWKVRNPAICFPSAVSERLGFQDVNRNTDSQQPGNYDKYVKRWNCREKVKISCWSMLVASWPCGEL